MFIIIVCLSVLLVVFLVSRRLFYVTSFDLLSKDFSFISHFALSVEFLCYSWLTCGCANLLVKYFPLGVMLKYIVSPPLPLFFLDSLYLILGSFIVYSLICFSSLYFMVMVCVFYCVGFSLMVYCISVLFVW